MWFESKKQNNFKFQRSQSLSNWASENMAEWELSKENIQPLRQGRKISAMLDPAADAKKITEEKQ